MYPITHALQFDLPKDLFERNVKGVKESDASGWLAYK
jgi:hypothetical protein